MASAVQFEYKLDNIDMYLGSLFLYIFAEAMGCLVFELSKSKI